MSSLAELRNIKLARNPRLLFWVRAFFDLKVLNPVIVLFYLHRQVAIDEIFYLAIVFSIGTVLFEIPSGYMADRIGRKRVLMFGLLVTFASHVYSLWAEGFWAFALIMVMISFANSCFSGTGEALLYDTLKELKREKEMVTHAARISAARHFLKLLLPLVVVIVGTDLVESQFDLMIWINIFVMFIPMVVLLFITEPYHHKSLIKDESMNYLESLKAISKEPFLLRSAMNTILVFAAGYVVFRAYQPLLTELGVGVLALSLLYFFSHGGSFLGKWFLGSLLKVARLSTLLHITIGLLLVSVVIGAVSRDPRIVYPALLIFMTLASAREPVFSEAVNRRIGSSQRATTLSNLAFISGLINVPIFLLAGHLALKGVQYPIWISVALIAVVILFFSVKSEEVDLK